MLIDSHCHLDQLDLTEFNNDLTNALTAAEQNGVTHILNVCIDLENFPRVLEIAKAHPHVYASVGLHPNEQVIEEPTTEELVQYARDEKIVAIGETGLDYYRSEGDLSWQQDRFRRHIAAAKECHKPLIVHTRQAREDTITILNEEGAALTGGVLHCFTEDWVMAKKALDLGFYLSFSGIITFKNAVELHEVVKQAPLEKILIETDAPYLAPVPFRGKSNQPAYVRYVAERIAELKKITFEKVAEQTTKNFFDLFIR
jgi:TatD DNase family protein